MLPIMKRVTLRSDLSPLAKTARRLGVSPEWLNRQALLGRVPSTLVDNRLLFHVTSVKAAIVARARGVSAPAATPAPSGRGGGAK